jgi:hypothetical protein
MTRSGKSLLLTAALIAAAGGAYAADPQQGPQASQLSSSAPPAPAASPTLHARAQHFEPPPGYYENQLMVPYSRPGYGPKPN